MPQHHKGFRLAGKSDLMHLRHMVALHHIRQQTDQIPAVGIGIELHKTIFPDISHRTALAIHQIKMLVIYGSLNVGAAKIYANIHSFPPVFRKRPSRGTAFFS